MRKTDLYLLEYIQTEMSQSQIMPQMIQYTVFYDALWHKEAVHEEKHFADYLKLVALTHEKKRRCPRGRIYNPYDDTLAMTALADSNLPTLLLTDFKI